jgi:hypothetical protein
MKIQSVSLGLIPDYFHQCGFTDAETKTILSMMMQLWRCNDHNYDLTCEFIRTEIDLDELTAQTFIVLCINELYEIAEQVRAIALTGKLQRWTVCDYVILLELDE